MVDYYGWNRLLIVVATGCFVQVDLHQNVPLFQPHILRGASVNSI